MRTIKYIFVFCFLLSVGISCKNSKSETNNSKLEMYSYQKLSPDFSQDSAYVFVEKQVEFGHRLPNTKEHQLCGDYLVGKLKDFGADVIEQNFVMQAYNGTNLQGRNIIGSYNPELKKRILLFAHWDTRPFADQEGDGLKQNRPILGANDGGSGVGVLLEIARQLGIHKPNIGIDIIFFDLEDYGPPSFSETNPDGDWWCLGSQYWGNHPHIDDYKANFGILLDMVGAPNPTFYREYFSMYYAEDVVAKVWSTARQLGYSKSFLSDHAGGITDDHVFVNQFRKIPSIDIIDLKKEKSFSFNDTWHTHDDNMGNISKESLGMVGQTVLEVIFKEEKNDN